MLSDMLLRNTLNSGNETDLGNSGRKNYHPNAK